MEEFVSLELLAFFSLLIYFVICRFIYGLSCFCYRFKEVENKFWKEKLGILKCYFERKKVISTPLKFVVYKRSTLDRNLNVLYIWQNKAMNCLQFLLKLQRLMVVLVLVIF